MEMPSHQMEVVSAKLCFHWSRIENLRVGDISKVGPNHENLIRELTVPGLGGLDIRSTSKLETRQLVHTIPRPPLEISPMH